MGRKISKVGRLIAIGCIVFGVGNFVYAQTSIQSSGTGPFKPGSDPDGFRGITWGQDISTVNGLVYSFTNPAYGGIEWYTRKRDEKKIGLAELSNIFYGFWRGKFYSVRIDPKDFMNWNHLKEITFEKFGGDYQWLSIKIEKEGYYFEDKFFTWEGDKAKVSLNYNWGLDEGHLSMSSQEIAKQQEEWEEQQLKEGVEKGW